MKLLVIGAGGFGREAAWTAETAGFEIAGICDDDPGAAVRCAGRPFFGSIENAVREGLISPSVRTRRGAPSSSARPPAD